MSGEREVRQCPLTAHRLPLTAAVWLGIASCVTPLTNRIAVGEQPFVIGVGEGADSATDLFAAPAGGGSFVRLTFNRAVERLPSLAPEGLRVAYLRRAAEGKGPVWSLVVLDLVTSSERTAALPPAAGAAERLGWSRDGRRVIVRAQAGGFWETAVPPGKLSLTPAPDSVQADSLTTVLLGEPSWARIAECGGELCIRSATGEVTRLGPGVSGAIRWGADSVGYFEGSRFAVRPLGAGRLRQPAWSNAPARLRELTYHAGTRSPP